MTHLYFGDSDKAFSMELAKTLTIAGADILEIGIPYSDPVCDGEEFFEVYDRHLKTWESLPLCSAVIVAVKHEVFFKEFPLLRLKEKLYEDNPVIVDLKGIYNREASQSHGLNIWRL